MVHIENCAMPFNDFVHCDDPIVTEPATEASIIADIEDDSQESQLGNESESTYSTSSRRAVRAI